MTFKIGDTTKAGTSIAFQNKARVAKIEMTDATDGMYAVGTIEAVLSSASLGEVTTSRKGWQATIAVSAMPKAENTTIAELCALFANKFSIDANGVVTVLGA